MMRQKRPRILLTGRNGQVGSELERVLPAIGKVYAFGRKEMDLSKPVEIREAVARVKPDIIVNPAAYTLVDNAENEPDLAMAVNGIAPGILAGEAKRCDALLVHYSTDYVFDGKKGKPYTEEDEPNPLNVYGKTKLAGERALQEIWSKHLIIRSSWIYGSRGDNFLLSILRLAREEKEIRVVDDQVGTPTWCRRVASASLKMIDTLYVQDEFSDFLLGTYHVASSGNATRSEFAREIISAHPGKRHADCRVIPIRSCEYPSIAKRPEYSALDCNKARKAFGLTAVSWKDDITHVLEELNEEY